MLYLYFTNKEFVVEIKVLKNKISTKLGNTGKIMKNVQAPASRSYRQHPAHFVTGRHAPNFS
ncbi:hypothetical protein NUACC26_007840 [Scytonema sp. NUACC26]